MHFHAREPLYSNSAVIACWLQPTIIVYLAVNEGNILVIFFTSENNRELVSLINPAVYLLKNVGGLSDSRYSTRVMPKM